MMRALHSTPSTPTTRRRGAATTRGFDSIFIATVLLLTALGLVMAYSTTFFWSEVSEGNPLTIFIRQVIFAALGMLAFVVLSRIDYGILRRYSVFIMGACLLLVIAVLVLGAVKFGARRSFSDGSIQPSEAMKIAIIVYGAAWLASRREQVQSIANGLLPFGVIVGVVSFFVAIQPDLSTAATIVLIAMVMFFMAGASWKQLLLVGAIAVGAFALLFAVWPHASDRVNEFIKIWREPNSKMDYHIWQSLVTLGGGGLFGNGIGAGGQKFGYLPTPHTDSVVAVLGEEMGLVGLLLMIALFIIFAWRGLLVANKADTPFGSYIVIGVVVWVIGQMLMNVLAMLAMIPFTGVPVPFLSVGGSSLVSLLAACGIVASISRGSKLMQAEDAEQRSPRSQTTANGGSFRASASVRGRNSGSRFARTHRAKRASSAARQDGADATIVGRDVRFTDRLRSGRPQPIQRANRSVVRWRGNGHGA